MSRRPASRRSNTVPPTGLLGVLVLDALHRLVVQAEVMTELVDDGFTHELRHLLLVDAVFLDRPLVDRHRVGEDVAVARVAAREIDAPVEPVERVGRLDAQLGERRVLRPGLDDDRDVGELVLELPGQASERPVHQRLELPPRHPVRGPSVPRGPGAARRGPGEAEGGVFSPGPAPPPPPPRPPDRPALDAAPLPRSAPRTAPS